MATKIKDSATAERAALKLNEGIEAPASGEPGAPKEKTTAERLFPEFVGEDGSINNRPVRPFADTSKPLPAQATPEVKPQDQTPVTPPPTAPVYLKPEELTGKMVRLKVDGVEQDVPAESLIKTSQLERHLNARLMEVAQEARRLEDERRRLQAPPQAPEKKPEPPVKRTPELEAMEQRYQILQEQMATLQASLMPQVEEAGKKRVAQMVKERIGADDFDAYYDRIKAAALNELAKPEVQANPQASRWFNSPDFAYQQYQEMKLKDLVTKPAAPAPAPSPAAPALVTETGAPVVVTSTGKVVNIPTFESSGGVPSRTSPDADWQSTYNALLQRAQSQNTDENWMAVMRHKFNRQ